MEKDHSNSDHEKSSGENEPLANQSFVGKFKSHVSGIINNTPLSKWFRRDSAVRRRDEVFDDDEDEEEFNRMQPPSKRARLPEDNNLQSFKPKNLGGEASATANIQDKAQGYNSFPEPVAGPSGITSRKQLNRDHRIAPQIRERTPGHSTFLGPDLSNGQKDSDSEESTSGYSSVVRIGSKEHVCESMDSSKQTSPLENSPRNSRSLFYSTRSGRSLFVDRNSSPNLNSSLSSRWPSFNASSFASANFVDKTLQTKRIINSPFYNGQTTYGGSSAYRLHLNRSPKDLSSTTNSVQIQPVNNSSEGNVILGKTARRILDALQHYTSPINDAKKIPVASKKARQEGILSKYTSANPYQIRNVSKVASNKELQVPSVSDLLKLKQRQRLQDSTESVRQIVNSKSNFNVDYSIRTEVEKPSHIGKIKSKVSGSIRQKAPVIQDTVDEFDLVAVPLQITTLPKIDLQLKPIDSVKETSIVTATTTKSCSTEEIKSSTIKSFDLKPKNQLIGEKQSKFTFSKPLVIADNVKSLKALNHFKFSEPLCKKLRSNEEQLKKPTIVLHAQTIFNPQTKNKEESTVSEPKTSDTNLTSLFKPAKDTWECSVCLIRNVASKTKCAACEATKTPKTTFEDKFKMSQDQWECSSCMVRNSLQSTECVCCKAPKPGPKQSFEAKLVDNSNTWQCSTCLIRNKNSLEKCAACEASKPGQSTTLMSFKPASNTWECNVCMIRNKDELDTCQACTNPKPGKSKTQTNSFGKQFAKHEKDWECSVCMIVNKQENLKCLCCESAKPGAPVETSSKMTMDKTPTFNFGINKSAAAQFSFGIPPEKNVPSTEKIVPLIPNTTSNTTPPTFTFGIKPSSPVVEPKPLDKDKSPEKVQSNKPLEFSFGAPSSSLKADVTEKAPETTKLVASSPVTINGDKNSIQKTDFPNKVVAPEKAAPKLFSFGSKPISSPAPLEPTKTSNSLFKFDAKTDSNATFEGSVMNNGLGKPQNKNSSAPTFSFGSTASLNSSAPIKSFTFGDKASFDKVSTFSTSETPTTTKSDNLFASTVVASPSFSFGSNAATSNESFGQNNSEPKNGSFSFGTTTAAPVFSFGGTSTNKTTKPTQPFTFGSVSQASSSNSSFAPPSFDASIKPSFKFTDGNPTLFSAPPPGEGNIGPRKVKKAIRRTHR